VIHAVAALTPVRRTGEYQIDGLLGQCAEKIVCIGMYEVMLGFG
jgi:hypothetical protein